MRCRGRNIQWAARYLGVEFRTESWVNHTDAGIITEQPKARQTNHWRTARKSDQRSEGFRYDERDGEDSTMLRAHGEIPTKRKRLEMYIRKKQLRKFLAWEGGKGIKRTGGGTSLEPKRQFPLWGWGGGGQTGANEDVCVGQALTPNSVQCSKKLEGVVSWTVSTKKSYTEVVTPSASRCDLI